MMHAHPAQATIIIIYNHLHQHLGAWLAVHSPLEDY